MAEPKVTLEAALSSIFTRLHNQGMRVASYPRVRAMLEKDLGRECRNFGRVAVTRSRCYGLLLAPGMHGIPHFLLVRKVPAELVKRGWPEIEAPAKETPT